MSSEKTKSGLQSTIMNVEEYLARIAYTGSREPTLENLGAISLAHKIAIAYTTVDIFGGERVVLDLETIYKKVIVNKCGGLCYELNALFKWLLENLGYKVRCGQGAIYIAANEDYTVPFYHMLPFIDIDGEYYFCDPGWITVGPMKMKHMHPHVETHAMFRARRVPDRDDSWYFIERHKKTVLDKDGNVLKQGPAPPGNQTGYCDEECAKEDSDHWNPLFRTSLEPKALADFNECNDMHQDDPSGWLRTSIIIHRFEPDRFYITNGDLNTLKESVYPNTDKILVEETMHSDEEVVRVCKEWYKYDVRHEVTFFSGKKKAEA